MEHVWDSRTVCGNPQPEFTDFREMAENRWPDIREQCYFNGVAGLGLGLGLCLVGASEGGGGVLNSGTAKTVIPNGETPEVMDYSALQMQGV